MKKRNSLARLFSYMKKQIPVLVTVAVLCMISVGLTVYGTTFLEKLTNYINNGAQAVFENADKPISEFLSMKTIIIYCLTLGGTYLGAVLCNYAQSFLMTGVIQKTSKKLREDIADKINRLSVAYFDKTQTGDILSRITNDVDTIAHSLNTAVSTTVSSIFQFVIVLAVMFVTRWEMALTSVATVPFMLFIMCVVVRFSQKHFKNQQKELGRLNGIAEEYYSGLSVIHAYCAEEEVKTKFSDCNLKLMKNMRKANAMSGITHPLTTFVSKIGYIAICVVGGILISNGKTELGALAAFLIYINLFQSSLSSLGQAVNVFQQASAASARVFDFLGAEEQADESAKQPLLLKSVEGNVAFRNVNFGYDKSRPIIHNFNATVKQGQKVAIVGPTGAGKTTLVNLLMRFYETDFGDILIDGVSVKDMKREEVRRLFGMVLQDTWMFDGSLEDNIKFVSQADEARLDEVIEKAQLKHLIKNLPQGVKTVISNEGFSAGQKQLVTIARAMLKDSPMLILDEATSNVDTRTEQMIQSAMDELTKDRTSFVIAHRLSTIKNADLILVLKDGDIVEQGNHTELIKQNGFYAQLYNSQFA